MGRRLVRNVASVGIESPPEGRGESPESIVQVGPLVGAHWAEVAVQAGD